jgi:peptidylprolyl isomerase domain and WD repeat-containing protein 1
MVRILGKDENHRFLQLSLLPALLRKEEIMTVVSTNHFFPSFFLLVTQPICFTLQAMAISDNPLLADEGRTEPSLFCTAFKRPRFYIFNQTEPES